MSRDRPKSLSRTSLSRLLAIVLATVGLLWPAIWSGFPLLFPDSMTYLAQGHSILAKLRGHEVVAWQYDSLRSEFFSIGLVFLHHGPHLWPIAIVLAGMTAWVLWLVVWSLCPAKPLQTYLLSMAPVVLLTTAPWFASFVMPDILGPLVYLAFFLIAFLPRSLSRWESGGLLAIGFWGITSHSTHLLLAIIECLFFIVVWVFCRPEMRPALCGILRCAAVVMVAISSQFLIHFRLYGEASLFGHPPPFLTGRLLADGPARTYLQQNCLHSTWVLCAHLEALPLKENDFFGRRTVFG